MNVLKSVEALLEHAETVDPHGTLDPELLEVAPETLARRLLLDLPGQIHSAADWKAQLDRIKDPLEAARVVMRWVQHRDTTLQRQQDLTLAREAES